MSLTVESVAFLAIDSYIDSILSNTMEAREALYGMGEIRLFISSLRPENNCNALQNLLALSEKCISPLFNYPSDELPVNNLTIEVNSASIICISLFSTVVQAIHRIKQSKNSFSSSTSMANPNYKNNCEETIELLFLASSWQGEMFFAVCEVLMDIYHLLNDHFLQEFEVRQIFSPFFTCISFKFIS